MNSSQRALESVLYYPPHQNLDCRSRRGGWGGSWRWVRHHERIWAVSPMSCLPSRGESDPWVSTPAGLLCWSHHGVWVSRPGYSGRKGFPAFLRPWSWNLGQSLGWDVSWEFSSWRIMTFGNPSLPEHGEGDRGVYISWVKGRMS